MPPAAPGSPSGFATFEHTADIGLEAWGPTFADALTAAGLGLQSLIVPEGRIRPDHQHRMTVQADDPGALVVAWLNELLFAFDVESLVFASFDLCERGGSRLDVIGHGEPVDLARHRLGTAIKAATYHELDVQISDARARIRVILDA